VAFALNALGQIALAVRDVDAAERFYGDVLGLRKLYRFGDLLFYDMAGVRLLVEKCRGDFQKANATLYFRVADIALAYRTLADRGIAFTGRPHRIATMQDHDLWMAFFSDPDGNSLALMHEAPKGYTPDLTGS
jgi:methylmalonyl-CoA/ethylmalonyl-CoA epimerase